MSITRRCPCPWCGEDHPFVPCETQPGRQVAICSLLGRAYANVADSVPEDIVWCGEEYEEEE